VYFQYGAHIHPPSEVNLSNFEVLYRLSERGKRMTKTVRLHLSGELCYTGQAALTTKINELINAYAFDGYDAVLYQDDGTPTPHAIYQNNADNLTGVKITHRSWPKGDPAEYATARTFYIVLEATFRDLDSEILSFRESIRFMSDGGPGGVWYNMPTGAPRYQQVCQFTTQKIIQCGECVGFDGYPLPRLPGPVLPVYEQRFRRQIDMIGPTLAGRQYTHYGVKWCYYHEAPSDQSGSVIPNFY